MTTTTIRFFDDRQVRAVWDDEQGKWWFSVLDIVAVLRNVDDYEKNRNYWKYLSGKLKREKKQLGSHTTHFKFTAPDGKKRMATAIDDIGVIELAKHFPSKEANRFIQWFIHSGETLDSKSKSKAYALFNDAFLNAIEVGTIKGLQQIHAYLFGGLYDFAGQIRDKNISKSGFLFATAQFLPKTLQNIQQMSEENFENIVKKYIEMNIAHPFLEGNGRSTRIWLDLMLKKNLSQVIDWSQINKNDYLEAMKQSVTKITTIQSLLENALTDKIDDRELFMKGIDYSYYYEE